MSVNSKFLTFHKFNLYVRIIRAKLLFYHQPYHKQLTITGFAPLARICNPSVTIPSTRITNLSERHYEC